MTEHTQEPWTFREDGDANHFAILTEDGKRWVISFLANGEQMPAGQIANARRIVAAVNAVAGIPTEVLEAYAGTALRDALDDYAAKHQDDAP